MKKLLCLLTFLIAAQTTASHYDVIYSFESRSATNDDFFVIKLDFDYAAPDGPNLFGQQQVFSYEQFHEQLMGFQQGESEFRPIFFFEIVLIDTNISSLLTGNSIGHTSIIANEQPMITGMNIDGSGNGGFLTFSAPPDFQYFPSGWELGQLIVGDSGFGEVFELTEIIQVPLPAALPLFGFSLLLLARSKRN